MTLIVRAWQRSADDAVIDLEPVPPHNDLAGCESARQSFYGSKLTRTLGLSLLATIKDGDIYAEGDDLDLLEREVKTLLANIVPGDDEGYWVFRLNNILEAIRLAKAVAGGAGVVYIG